MRIIGGEFKGRKFYPPADKWPTRPTTDYAKEALFNILNNTFDFEEMKVLDLFGGTGSHCYEFISRGCRDVTYVDKFVACIKFVKQTVATLKIESHIQIVQADVFKFLDSQSLQYDYIFADPPYELPNLDLIPELILSKDLLRPDGWFVMEHSSTHSYKHIPELFDVRNYGKTCLSFFAAR